MALLRRIRRRGAAALTFFFLLGVTGIVCGQQDDPSDIFLKVYLSAQQGEKLEHQNRFKTALAKYRFAGSLIEELRKSHPDWQPAVVDYRGRKISEGILRLQKRMTRQTQLNASTSPLPEIAPAAPESNAWSEPGPEVVAPQLNETVSETSRDTAIKDATTRLRDEVNQLQAVVSGDGRWKLQVPHTYRTLGGKPGGHGGMPAPYEQRKLERAELYDLQNDISEATDVSAQHPDIVKRLEAEAEKARQELGDALTKRTGKATRQPGRAVGQEQS